MTAVAWGQYSFTSYDPGTTTWNDVAGIYIFARPFLGQWQAIYVGQASSFKDRLGNHERWTEALRRGATHIHALIVPLQASRNNIEQSLIQTYQPPLNQQLK